MLKVHTSQGSLHGLSLTIFHGKKYLGEWQLPTGEEASPSQEYSAVRRWYYAGVKGETSGANKVHTFFTSSNSMTSKDFFHDLFLRLYVWLSLLKIFQAILVSRHFFYLCNLVQQTQILIFTKICAVCAIKLLVSILLCPSFDIRSNQSTKRGFNFPWLSRTN